MDRYLLPQVCSVSLKDTRPYIYFSVHNDCTDPDMTVPPGRNEYHFDAKAYGCLFLVGVVYQTHNKSTIIYFRPCRHKAYLARSQEKADTLE